MSVTQPLTSRSEPTDLAESRLEADAPIRPGERAWVSLRLPTSGADGFESWGGIVAAVDATGVRVNVEKVCTLDAEDAVDGERFFPWPAIKMIELPGDLADLLGVAR